MPHKHPDHIDKHEEWQNHQFDPGYFTGGKVPGWLHSPGKPKLLGAIFLLAGIASILAGGAMFLITGSAYVGFGIANIGDLITTIVIGILSIILIIAGIKLLRRK